MRMKANKSLVAATAIMAGAVLMVTPAQAGIPIPCTGEKLTKISENGVARPDGSTVYLGYKTSYCITGEWVGYVSDTQYMTLPNQTDEATIAAAFGYAALPDAPGFFSTPGTFWVEWLWLVIGGFGVHAMMTGNGQRRATA